MRLSKDFHDEKPMTVGQHVIAGLAGVVILALILLYKLCHR